MKWIWFRFSKWGQAIPVYYRKPYKKARYKRKSERMAPGFWNSCVKDWLCKPKDGEQKT